MTGAGDPVGVLPILPTPVGIARASLRALCLRSQDGRCRPKSADREQSAGAAVAVSCLSLWRPAAETFGHRALWRRGLGVVGLRAAAPRQERLL